jgi:hypothetical protein
MNRRSNNHSGDARKRALEDLMADPNEDTREIAAYDMSKEFPPDHRAQIIIANVEWRQEKRREKRP